MTAMDIRGVSGPLDLADRLRRQVVDRRTAMRQATRNRPLTVNCPPGCSTALAERIDAHNAGVGAWEAAWETLGDDAADLAAALTKPCQQGDGLAGKAAGLRAKRYDLAQRMIDLIVDRGKVLEAVREHLTPLIGAAEADLATTREKAEKALRKAGWQSQAARTTGPGTHPDAEAKQQRAEVDRTEPVCRAAQALAALNTADAQVRELLAAQASDSEVAAGETLAAWAPLVGSLV